MGFDLKKLIFMAALVLSACGGLPIEEVPLHTPLLPPENAKPTPIGFNEIRLSVKTGTPTKSQSPKGMFGFLLCNFPYGVTETGLRGRGFPSDERREIFLEVMEGMGYDVTGNPGRLFDENEDLMRTVYAVGGRVVDAKIDVCERESVWQVPLGDKGEAQLTVEWTVFDTLKRKNIYKTTTKGYAQINSPNLDGSKLLFEEALAGAIHNLGAQKNFYDLVFFGIEPKNKPETYEDPYEEPVNIFEANEPIVITAQKEYTTAALGRLEDIAKSVVVVQTGIGHGSGIFLSKEGHILTNAHVVGNADRVRIVTSGKEEKLVAKVLKVQRKRDVALLQVEKLPNAFNVPVVPIRQNELRVGEDVYAIGAPRLTRLQDTVTKGIVSAYRYDRRTSQTLIQADVAIHGGNSGGPLLDAHGNLTGIAVSGYDPTGYKINTGLNNFIPIMTALEKLNVELTNTDKTPLTKPAAHKPLSLK